MSLASVSYSNQVPRVGIIWDVIINFPFFLSISFPKYTLGERTNCETITRSAPLITKVPLSVIMGISPKNISCSFTSPVSWLNKRAATFKGAANVAYLSLQPLIEYLGSSNVYSPNSNDKFPVKLSTGKISSKTSFIPSVINQSYDFFWISNRLFNSIAFFVFAYVRLSRWSPNFLTL